MNRTLKQAIAQMNELEILKNEISLMSGVSEERMNEVYSCIEEFASASPQFNCAYYLNAVRENLLLGRTFDEAVAMYEGESIMSRLHKSFTDLYDRYGVAPNAYIISRDVMEVLMRSYRQYMCSSYTDNSTGSEPVITIDGMDVFCNRKDS